MPTPAQLLDAAEQEFQHHRFTAGANLVWDAAYQSVAAAASRDNLHCRNEQEAYDAATLLNQQQPDHPVDHWLQLRLADVFRSQAAHHGENADWQWAPDEYIENLYGIREMVAHLSQNGMAVKTSAPSTAPTGSHH